MGLSLSTCTTQLIEDLRCYRRSLSKGECSTMIVSRPYSAIDIETALALARLEGVLFERSKQTTGDPYPCSPAELEVVDRAIAKLLEK